MADCTTVKYDRVTTSERVLRGQYTYEKNMKLLFRWMNEKKTFHVYLKDADIGSVAFIEYLLLLQPFWFLKNHRTLTNNSGKVLYDPSDNTKYTKIPIYSWEYIDGHFVGTHAKDTTIKNTKTIQFGDKELSYAQYSILLNYAKTKLYQNIISFISASFTKQKIKRSLPEKSFYIRFNKNGTNGSNMLPEGTVVKCVKIGRFSTLQGIQKSSDNILQGSKNSAKSFLDLAFYEMSKMIQVKLDTEMSTNPKKRKRN